MIDTELLYFNGCPSWESAWSELGQAPAQSNTDATVRLQNVAKLPLHRCTASPVHQRSASTARTSRITPGDLPRRAAATPAMEAAGGRARNRFIHAEGRERSNSSSPTMFRPSDAHRLHSRPLAAILKSTTGTRVATGTYLTRWLDEKRESVKLRTLDANMHTVDFHISRKIGPRSIFIPR
jgi:hypothetical protein